MHTTRSSLLMRVRDRGDDHAWSDFHNLYAPLIYGIARSRGLSHDDAEEVRSACYETIVKQIGDMEYDRNRGRFRGWLRTIVDRRIADQYRKQRPGALDSHELAGIPDSDATLDEMWETEWRRHHLRFCMSKARLMVSETTYRAFCLLVDEDSPVDAVCAQLQLTPNQVYKAKSQMLAKIRETMRTLFPEEADTAT